MTNLPITRVKSLTDPHLPSKPIRPRANRDDWREWWRLHHEEGLSEPEIARRVNRDARTVKRGIRLIGAEGDDRQLRTELKKEAYAKHVAELLKFAGRIRDVAGSGGVPDLSPVYAVFEPQGASLKPPGLKLLWSADRLAQALLPAESTLEWKMLNDHVKKGQVWPAIARWKRSAAAVAEAERDLALDVVKWLEQVTGLRVFSEDPPEPHAHLRGAHEVYERALGEAAGAERRLASAGEHLTQQGGVIRLGSDSLVTGADDAGTMLEKLRVALRSLPRRLKLERLKDALGECREAAGEVATELGYLQAGHYLAGKCRACAVLGR